MTLSNDLHHTLISPLCNPHHSSVYLTPWGAGGKTGPFTIVPTQPGTRHGAWWPLNTFKSRNITKYVPRRLYKRVDKLKSQSWWITTMSPVRCQVITKQHKKGHGGTLIYAGFQSHLAKCVIKELQAINSQIILKKWTGRKNKTNFSTFSFWYRVQRTNMISKLTDFQLPTIQLNKTISYKILINHVRRRGRKKNKEVRTNPPQPLNLKTK